MAPAVEGFIEGTLKGAPVATTVPLKRVSGPWWHQGHPMWPLVSCSRPAHVDGRWHRKGGIGAWYASSSERGAWCELFRHTLEPLPSPFEVRRKVGKASVVSVLVLDLTDPEVLDALELTRDELIGDATAVCQELSELALVAGCEEILAPGAALPDTVTLVVFGSYLDDRVTLEHDRIQRPPSTVADVIDRVRPVPEASRALWMYYEKVARGGRLFVQRERRRR